MSDSEWEDFAISSQLRFVLGGTLGEWHEKRYQYFLNKLTGGEIKDGENDNK